MSNDIPSGSGDMIIVAGPSVGAAETLSLLFSTLPDDLPAPLLVVLNLEQSRIANLIATLRQTRFRLELVDGQHALQPGTIYVHPAYRRLALHEDRLELGPDEGSRASLDQLLAGAAAVYGDRLTVVVLAGSGPDGAAGLVEVKNAGGVIILQNPQQARFPSLPVALPPTAVDAEAHVEQIGPLLHDLLSGLSMPQQSEKGEDFLRRILEQVGRQANIDFRPYKTSTLLRRISRRMVTTHAASLREYTEYIESHPDETGELVKSFLINVTQFFRDAEAFDYLRAEVLPHLIDQARQRDHVLRFWSAGCATGEEPYSLAMLLADMLGTEFPAWTIKIFATDLDGDAITFARRAIFAENLLKGLPDGYAERYFERVEHGYRISKALRQLVIFGQQDLSRSAPFPRIDLVLCRNLLIYFTPELQDYILNQFAFSIRPTQGYVLLGKAETVRPTHSYYELVNKQWKVYRCIGKALPIPRRPGQADSGPRRVKSPVARHPLHMRTKPQSEEESGNSVELNHLRRYNDLLLRFLPLGVAVIDRAYRLLSVNPAARRLLGLHEGRTEQDFLHAVAVHGIPYADVRGAIDLVFREQRPITLNELELKGASIAGQRYFSLTIVPMHAEGEALELATITMIGISDQVQIRRELETMQASQNQLVSDLSIANKQLNEINQELVDANEEFQVSNEELVLTQEELQATNEEFEATNEELQATNEELETNNEELQATNEELQATNDELRSRTLELQDLTSMLDGDRLRLAEMIELAPFYILVLQGPTLIVDAYNPRYARLLEGREIRGRPLGEVFTQFWGPDDRLLDLALGVFQTGAQQTSGRLRMQLPSTSGHSSEIYFTFTLIPTHDPSGKIDGVVIYGVDITSEQAQEARAENERLRLIFEHAPAMALGLYHAETATLMLASPRLLELIQHQHGLKHEQAIGKSWAATSFGLPPAEAGEIWRQALAQRERVRLPEVALPRTSGGDTTIWDWSLTPIMDDEQPDRIRWMLLSAVDISEQVAARHEVERLDRLKTDFLAMVSHELRAPLTPLMGYTEVIGRIAADQQQGHEPARQRIGQLSGMVGGQLRRLNRLIEDLVDLGRIESGKLALQEEQVNLAQLAERCAVEARIQTQQEVVVCQRAGSAELVVWGDKDRLAQVLLNLLRNAIVHAKSSERIEIVLDEVEHDGHPSAELGVRDYGPGIPQELQRSIFKRFVQGDGSAPPVARSHGLGLGLYISSQILEQHGGSCGLVSEPGEGSCFFMRLPLIRREE